MSLGDEVDPLALMPRRFSDATDFAAYAAAVAVQKANDEAFALANNAVVLEGPWDGVPAQRVAYLGIAEGGERVPLPAIAAAWRYSPTLGSYRPNGDNKEIAIRRVHAPDATVVRRVLLGRPMAGMAVGRAGGRAPVQAHGVIDGADYYFRARGEHWSMAIGGDLHSSPDWYYEEPCGTWPDAGGISPEQAYDFIAEAAAKFRAGVPTTTTRSVDKGTQSILDAIQQLTSE